VSDKAQQRMQELEKKLAYDAARADIGSFCLGHVVKKKQWFDLKLEDIEIQTIREFTTAAVKDSVEYLELRGLLERHPTKPWVHVMELPA
jgi:hypothetical protein